MPTTIEDLVSLARSCSQAGFTTLTDAVGHIAPYGSPRRPPPLTRHLHGLIAAGALTYRGREWNLSLQSQDPSYQSYLKIVDSVQLSVKGLARAKNPPSLLLTGPPGIGKSQLARNIVDIVAEAAGGHVAFFKFTKQNVTKGDPMLEPLVEIPFWKRAGGWYDKMILAPKTMEFLEEVTDLGHGEKPRGEQLRELPRADVVELIRLLTTEDRIGGIPQLKGRIDDDGDWNRYLGELDKDFTTGRRELSDLGALLYRRGGDVTLVVSIEEFGELHMEQQHALLPLIAAMGPKSGEIASPVDPKCLMGGYMSEMVMSERYNPRAFMIATSNDDMPLEGKVRTRMEKIEMPSYYSEPVYIRIMLDQIINAAVVHKEAPHRSASIPELEKNPAPWSFQSELAHLKPTHLHEMLSASYRFQATLGAFILNGSRAGVTVSEDNLEKLGCEVGSLRNALARDPKANNLFCRPISNTMCTLAWRDFQPGSITDTGENIALGLIEKIAGADATRDDVGRKSWIDLLKTDLDASKARPEFSNKSFLTQLEELGTAISRERELSRNDPIAANFNREMEVLRSIVGRDRLPQKAGKALARKAVAAWLNKQSGGKFNVDRLTAIDLSRERIMLLGLFREDGEKNAALPFPDEKFAAADFTTDDMRKMCRGFATLVLRDEGECVTSGNLDPAVTDLVLPEITADGDHFHVTATKVRRGDIHQLLNQNDPPETMAERLYPLVPGAMGVAVDDDVLGSRRTRLDPGEKGPRAKRIVVNLTRSAGRNVPPSNNQAPTLV